MTDLAAAPNPTPATAGGQFREFFRPKAASIEKDIDFNAPGALALGRDVGTFNPVRMQQFDVFTRYIVVAVAAFTYFGARSKGLAIELGGGYLGLCICAVMAILAVVYTRKRPAPRLAAAATMLAEQMLYGVLFIFFSYVAIAYARGEHGTLLAHLDKMLGFDWLAYKALLESSPTFVEILRECYGSIVVQNMLVPTALIIFGRLGWARVFMNCYALGGIATIVIAMLFPAIDATAIHVFDVFTTGASSTGALLTDEYLKLRAGVIRTLDFDTLLGIVSFPSFHTYLGLLYLFAAWPLRKLFVLLLPVNLLLIVATPKFGMHYLVDVVGGGLMAALIMGGVWRWLRRPTTAP